MKITLGNTYINKSFEEGRLHEALGNGLGALKIISHPLSSEWGIRKAIQDYLEKGTKVRKVPENRTQFHEWVSFKKKGGDIIVSVWIEDWCQPNYNSRWIGKKVTIPIKRSELIEYVERK